jgi:hypothetical protein
MISLQCQMALSSSDLPADVAIHLQSTFDSAADKVNLLMKMVNKMVDLPADRLDVLAHKLVKMVHDKRASAGGQPQKAVRIDWTEDQPEPENVFEFLGNIFDALANRVDVLMKNVPADFRDALEKDLVNVVKMAKKQALVTKNKR